MKELLRKAFEAGKDRQWDIEWQMGRSKPNFEEWYKQHESEALSIANVVGQSEQLPRCYHRRATFVTAIAETYCPECREIL